MTTAVPALPSVPPDVVGRVLSALPPLPAALRYYDDYLDGFHSIRDLATSDAWFVQADGRVFTVSFDGFRAAHRLLMKHVAVDLLSRLDPASVVFCFSSFLSVYERFPGGALLDALAALPAHELRAVWLGVLRPRSEGYWEASAVKTVLHSLCNLSLGPWRPDLRDHVSKLPGLKRDAYRTVRTGDCFVPLDQQSFIIDYFDEMVALAAAAPERIGTEELRDACVLAVVHQHAFRPGQVARIRSADVRNFGTGAVHLSVVLTKKRNVQNRTRVTRRMKREWCPLFVEFARRRRSTDEMPPGVAPGAFFGLTPRGVSDAVGRLGARLTGEAWTATDLRHTAAQRQADAGVSHLSLSEFMGHSSLRTTIVYFDTSPTQAQRVNQALGLSPIYSVVAEAARARSIDKAALLRLSADKQVGGVPHGIPIAGIGGCAIGQSLCTKNPVLGCYTCRRFMPLADTSVHGAVVESLRPVVLEFAEASRGNGQSPAYTQLRRTVEAASKIAADVRGEAEGTPHE